jgi:hypothetical protein
MAEENEENQTKNISSEDNEVVEDIESANVEVDGELDEIEEESIDEDVSEEVEKISEDLDNQSS